MRKKLFSFMLLGSLFLLGGGGLQAAPKKSHFPAYTPNFAPKVYSSKSYGSKAYTKKPPYAGYGKPSKANGYPKTKITSGHMKKTSKGYTEKELPSQYMQLLVICR
jgi:hypothetical protein